MSDAAQGQDICECGHNFTRHGTGSGCWDCDCERNRQPDPVAATRWDEFVERVSQELYDAGIRHHVTKRPGHTLALNIGGIASFSSVRELAEALERAGADFVYSAGSGFVLFRKEVAA